MFFLLASWMVLEGLLILILPRLSLRIVNYVIGNLSQSEQEPSQLASISRTCSFALLMFVSGFCLWSLGSGFIGISSMTPLEFILGLLMVPIFFVTTLFFFAAKESISKLVETYNGLKRGQLRWLGLCETGSGAGLLLLIYLFG